MSYLDAVFSATCDEYSFAIAASLINGFPASFNRAALYLEGGSAGERATGRATYASGRGF